MTSAIQIRHVAKAFGRHVALRDVSLDVPEGAIFGFLGPNGAGKTTTLRGCMGLMRFDSGEATVLGLDPWRDRVELHRDVGYLPSGMGVFGRMRGVDMLDYAARLGGRGDGRTSMRRRALDAVQLSDADLRRPVADYSKGMRQKVAIVQALQHAPRVLLMDEPSEGLDPLIQHGVYELVRELRDGGATVLFSSHTLSEIEALCDQVAIIRRGELVIEATLDELRAKRPRVVRIEQADGATTAAIDGFDFVRVDHLGRAMFSTRLEPARIVEALGQLTGLTDLVVEEPSLEEIFRSYYAGDGAPPDGGA
jgi:ABC-2 type transport system ATP-binding protein